MPEYDGERGQTWRVFKSKFLNELSRPGAQYAGLEYQFLYSKATGNFLKFLDAQDYSDKSFLDILAILDSAFNGTNPRLEALRSLENLKNKGISLSKIRDYYYSFQSLQRETGLNTKDL